MHTLVIGANGQLGSSINHLVKQKKISDRFIFTSKNQLDLSNIDNINAFIKLHKFDLIINCAAYTEVDKAESHEKEANLINHLAVKKIAEFAQNNSIKIIHISTDFVFDGLKNRPYLESDETNPLNIYGKTKLAGENAILSIMEFDAIIIRTSWLYSEYRNNFVDTILRLSQEKSNLNIVSDQLGAPTYANDLANVILSIVESEKFQLIKQKSKIYHYSNEGECSWYDFASEIINISGSQCVLRPISSISFAAQAKRPKKVLMSKQKISKEFNLKINFWKDSLKICMNNLSGVSTSK
jgi:dTDP-4-dehydrorhamnose reductase